MRVELHKKENGRVRIHVWNDLASQETLLQSVAIEVASYSEEVQRLLRTVLSHSTRSSLLHLELSSVAEAKEVFESRW